MFFDTLTMQDRIEVTKLVANIDEVDMSELTAKAGKLFPDTPTKYHKDFIVNMVAMIIADRQDTAEDYIDGELIPVLVNVLRIFCDWCINYITMGDLIPDYRISDIFIIASTSTHDYWHEPIANNLSFIPALVKETQGGKNVSTALFNAIINTAFDYDMGG